MLRFDWYITLAGKSHQNNMADVEEEVLLQANLFQSSFRPQVTSSSASKPSKTSILGPEGSVFNRFK